MFRVTFIASSSKGNGYIIEEDDKKILIDPGVDIKRIQKMINFTLSTFILCLVSHEHKDHCLSVKDVAKLGVPIVSSEGTLKAIGTEDMTGKFISKPPNKTFVIEGWSIIPIPLDHDSVEPFGYLIKTPKGKKILFATDTRDITYNFKGVTHYLVECNFSEDILSKNESLSGVVKDRIRQTHMSLEKVKNFFDRQDLSSTEDIFLIHLSENNSDLGEFRETIQRQTGVPTTAMNLS